MKNTSLISFICILVLALPAYGATVSIGNYTVGYNGSVIASMIASNVTNLGSVTVNFTYNASVVHVTSVDIGTGNAMGTMIPNIDNSTGLVRVASIDTTGKSGDVIIANFVLKAVGSGGNSSPLNITIVTFTDASDQPVDIPVTPVNGTFNTTALPGLSISANPTTVIAGTTANVTFNVTDNNGTAVPGANVNLSGAGVSSSNMTDATGIAIISVNASVAGTITATANLANYTNGTAAITATDTSGVILIIGDYSVMPNGYVVAQMIAQNVTNLGSLTVNLTYNASVVQVTSVDAVTGNALGTITPNINNSTGLVRVSAVETNGRSGDVIIANFTLNAIGNVGTSSRLNITVDSFDDIYSINIPVTLSNGTFNITAPPYNPPTPTVLSSTQGNFWINYTWSAGSGNVTDSYNVSVNGTWTNGSSNTFNNNSGLAPHGWSNISVYSFNSSGTGVMNSTPLSNNTQVANNPVIIGNITNSYTLTAGDTLSIYPNSSDPDGDTPVFDRNFTNGTFYANNGTLTWTTTNSDVGIHSWKINVADGFGSVSPANFTVNVVPLLIVSANPTIVNVGMTVNVIFNVTSNGTAVSGARVTLSGNATGSKTTNAFGTAIISVSAATAGTIKATATKTGYTPGNTTLTAVVPILNISANLTNVTVGTPFNVAFNVTSNDTAVSGVKVSLSGAGLTRTTGTTNTTGIAIIIVNAITAGTITANATKNLYTGGTVILNATDKTVTTIVNTNITANTSVVINATNTTNVQLDLNATISVQNVSVNITTSTNATLLNNIMPATPDYGVGTGRRQIGEYISVNMSGINSSNTSSWNFIKLMVYYNKSLPTFQVNSLGIYWYDPVRQRWNLLGPGVLPYPDFTKQGGPKVLYSQLNTSAGYILVTLNHLSEFVLAADEFEPEPPVPPTSENSGGGGGGGGGGGRSGENASNIEVIEKYDMQISKDVLTSFRFTHPKNPIMFVNITGNTSLGVITASIEVLKNTSTLVNVSPEGLVYKNANIWVGTAGFATPKNIKEALIKFKVDNSWISANGVSGSEVKMLKWDGSKWTQLETVQRTKDDKYTYYEAKTNSFSPFAISGLKGDVLVPTATPVVTETRAIPTVTPAPTATKKVPGFEFVLTVAILSMAYLSGRKRR